jgi:hypothetical protein
MGDLLAAGEIVVVETDEDWFLGTAEAMEGSIVVRSGYVGRPVIVAAAEVLSIIPAQQHPDVES